MNSNACTIGLDYGTNSVRALIVRCSDGAEMGVCVFDYPSGKQGILLDRSDDNLARQHPGDYVLGLEKSIKGAIEDAKRRNKKFDPGWIAGIGVDTTGSSPLPVDEQNRALGMLPAFKKNLNAQCWLWKDHTSWREAARITEIAAQHRPQYLAKCGGVYSSEWFWSKVWHCLNTDKAVFRAAHSWVELSDWIPSLLAGIQQPSAIRRNVCAAGHKAMYSEEWGGLPDEEFLAMLSPELAKLRSRLYDKAWDASYPAGSLCAAWAKKLGLREGIAIAMGEMDVHYGAVGSGVAEGTLVKVLGTSTCDCAVAAPGKKVPDVPGICGIVPGAILPGFTGLEAGQSAVGDIFKWWIETVCQGNTSMYAALEKEAALLEPGQSGLLALDWNNGNRTILVDPMLSGLLIGCSLHTTRAEIYRALIEATAFGARTIIERLAEYGVPVRRIVCAGGLAEKNALLMQIYADVIGSPLYVAGSSQACALGAAVGAAVAAGVYPNFHKAQKAMTSLKHIVYKPRPAARKIYNELYALYRQLHDAFGGLNRNADLSAVMKQLLQIKERTRKKTRS